MKRPCIYDLEVFKRILKKKSFFFYLKRITTSLKLTCRIFETYRVDSNGYLDKTNIRRMKKREKKKGKKILESFCLSVMTSQKFSDISLSNSDSDVPSLVKLSKK